MGGRTIAGTVMHQNKISSRSQITLPPKAWEAVGAKAVDISACEVEDNVVSLKRPEPFDAAFHQALAGTLDEWATEEDEEAFGDLQALGTRSSFLSLSNQPGNETATCAGIERPHL